MSGTEVPVGVGVPVGEGEGEGEVEVEVEVEQLGVPLSVLLSGSVLSGEGQGEPTTTLTR